MNHIELIEMDGEWVVMDTEGFTITKINRMGAYIVEALLAHKTIEQIIEMITRQFQADSEKIRYETIGFIQQLEKIGLVHEQR
ncbi:hypothetical protein BEP19_13130 [Ammoniphilus oxalaticus]|uniref:PqqD family protein n=1 Tax=Ammoniphilus oxalaticus TaxID=66863 RepID=A0A419SHE4_9BACL|nr:PqqD family protein [Ammoniphilus oxalaticus]RKD23155.1 hypothetical protein BEP19_13130 [Ammoniphilus oxalaticus]